MEENAQPQFPGSPQDAVNPQAAQIPQEGQFPQAGQFPQGGQYPTYPAGAPMPQYPGAPIAGQQWGTPGQLPASRGTATATGVLALLGVIHLAILTFAGFGLNASTVPSALRSGLETAGTVQGVEAAIGLLLLLSGGILILTRQAVGRWLVIAGCVVHIVGFGATAVMLNSWANNAKADGYTLDSQMLAGANLGMMLVLIFPVVTIVLAALPSTGRWLAEKQ